MVLQSRDRQGAVSTRRLWQFERFLPTITLCFGRVSKLCFPPHRTWRREAKPPTRRELEILKFLAEGNSVKEIACTLDLSVKTIEAHKFNLMRKLDIHNKAQLVQYAIQKKIIRLDG